MYAGAPPKVMHLSLASKKGWVCKVPKRWVCSCFSTLFPPTSPGRRRGWACEVPERWVCSCFSIFARKGNFPDFSRTPAVFDKACRQQVFLLVSWQHSSPGWADHRALINNCFYQGFQDLALEVEFLDFWSLSELQPWKGLLPEVSFLAKSKTSCESSKPYIYIWELLVVVIPYW